MTAAAPSKTTESFRDRYAVLRLGDGGVLVDLVEGEYAALNRSAAITCDALTSAADEAIALTSVERQLGLSRAGAATAIAHVREGLPLPPSPRRHVGAFSYERAAQGYLLTLGGRPCLEIDEAGERITLRHLEASAPQLYEYLRAVAPKVLFLRGAVVLHGGAYRVGNSLRAICGLSGAGKTTTVRAFGDAGLPVVAEDLLPLASLSPPSIYLDGERRVHAWAREVAREMAGGPRSDVETSGLRANLGGEALQVEALWFIEAAARHDEEVPGLRLRPLGQTEGAVSLMSAVFPGDATPEGWRRYLEVVGQIVSAVPLFEARAPNGLERLRQAVRRYAENSAS